MFDFEVSLFIYRFVNVLGKIIGILLTIVSGILVNKVSEKQGDELIKKKSNYILVFFGIILVVLAFIDFEQIYNVEDVFEGEYQYIGQTLNGKAHGKGRKYDNDGNLIYNGKFKANVYNGMGKLFFPPDEKGDIYRYEGEFVEGIYNGKGKMYLNDQLIYVGEYKENKRNGNGIGYYENGQKQYEGEYLNDVYDGRGKYYFLADKKGDIYRDEGKFAEGTYSGKGKMYLNDQLIYKGKYKENKKNGYGIGYYKDGQKQYEGEYWNDNYNGKGKYYYLADEKGDVYRYEGEFIEGIYNGKGKMYRNNQLIYEGEYKENKKNGYGIEYYKDGQKRYEGEYLNGNYDGIGEYYYLADERGNVYRYEGEFTEGTYNGKGKMYLK